MLRLRNAVNIEATSRTSANEPLSSPAQPPAPAPAARPRRKVDRRAACAVMRSRRSCRNMDWQSSVAEACMWRRRGHSGSGLPLQYSAMASGLSREPRDMGILKGSNSKAQSPKKTTPALQISACGVCSPRQASGAIVAGVPTSLEEQKSPGRKSMPTPRSMSTTRGQAPAPPPPSRQAPGRPNWGVKLLLLGGANMIFAALTSKWAIPRACKCANARTSCSKVWITKSCSSGCPFRTASRIFLSRSPPAQKSITRYTLSASS
mmetsp:Transcript_21354/g.57179  ORF Transcript_21354/g.57179 Transcript_21354/m.57179 type:complete len:263 (+) Transcript_21354:633-1421(+)